MKNVLVIETSPRKGGNSDQLASSVLPMVLQELPTNYQPRKFKFSASKTKKLRYISV
jgi:hypothetical protein